MLGIMRQPKPTREFRTGYAEASALVQGDPRLCAGEVLRQLGITPADVIANNYNMYNPAADRTTEERFGGNHHAFYQFADGADAALVATGVMKGEL